MANTKPTWEQEFKEIYNRSFVKHVSTRGGERIEKIDRFPEELIKFIKKVEQEAYERGRDDEYEEHI